jgi:hypothetical protein
MKQVTYINEYMQILLDLLIKPLEFTQKYILVINLIKFISRKNKKLSKSL